MAQPGEGRGDKTNFVADAERVFERGDLMISMMPTLGKTFRSFGKMNSIPTAGSFKEDFRQRRYAPGDGYSTGINCLPNTSQIGARCFLFFVTIWALAGASCAIIASPQT